MVSLHGDARFMPRMKAVALLREEADRIGVSPEARARFMAAALWLEEIATKDMVLATYEREE
jgi:hypothetical protein